MNDTEIKAKLFQQIDKLKNERLIELYGVVSNFINSSDNSEEWDKLTSAQKTGIEYGLAELENGKWEEHNIVMEELRKKYGIS
jgi:predicted transcriptional regulator